MTETGLKMIRHGKSLTNDEFRYIEKTGTVRENVPFDKEAALAPTGVEQAWSRGEQEADELPEDVRADVIVVWASDFERARQTATIAIARMNARRASNDQIQSPRIDPRLHENRIGVADPAYASRYPEFLQLVVDSHHEMTDPRRKMYERQAAHLTQEQAAIANRLGLVDEIDREGESLVEADGRLKEWFDEVQPILRQDGLHVYVFAHGGIIWTSRMSFIDETPEEVIARMEQQKEDGIPLWNGSASLYTLNGEGEWEMKEENWNRRLKSEQTP